MKKILASALFLATLTASACSKSATPTASVTVHAALSALETIVQILRDHPLVQRPSAPLGLYTSLFLAQHGFIPVTAAMQGVDVQMAINAPKNPINADDTFALLQEFGSVLQINIPDLLNRSQDRPTTLNDYMTGLGNITTRAQNRVKDLSATQDRLKLEQSDASAAVNAMQQSINKALQQKDYETLGSLQQPLQDAQTKLAGIQTEQKQTASILKTYNDLTALSVKRQQAINDNRAILLSGLKVVNVPGIEDLNILNTANSQSSRGGSMMIGL